MSGELITIQEREARITGGDGGEVRADLGRFVDALRRASITGLDEQPLPGHLAWKVDAGHVTVCVLEIEPALRRMEVITADSPAPFGAEARYAPRRLATPYIILKVPFVRGSVVPRCELFYRNEPLRSINDPLYWSNLFNVSPHAYSCKAWLCTQYLSTERTTPGINGAMHGIINHTFGGGWNRSSEAHEGASCFSKAATEKIDPRVTNVDQWEQESIKDPRFVLGVKWRPVGLTVKQLIEAELSLHRVVRDLGSITEVANVLMTCTNGNGRKA